MQTTMTAIGAERQAARGGVLWRGWVTLLVAWALALGKQTVEALEALLTAPVVIANRNSKRQVVIAGPSDAVDEAVVPA